MDTAPDRLAATAVPGAAAIASAGTRPSDPLPRVRPSRSSAATANAAAKRSTTSFSPARARTATLTAVAAVTAVLSALTARPASAWSTTAMITGFTP